MSGILLLVAGAIGGASLMHLVDRRRHRQSAESAQSVVSFDQDAPLTPQQKKDAMLVSLLEEDIRSRFTHPAALVITAQDGIVSLSGPVMAAEHERLVTHVRRFRGVRGVQDHLRPQKQRGDLPDVHSGSQGRDPGV